MKTPLLWKLPQRVLAALVQVFFAPVLSMTQEARGHQPTAQTGGLQSSKWSPTGRNDSSWWGKRLSTAQTCGPEQETRVSHTLEPNRDRRHHRITVGCQCRSGLWRVSKCEEVLVRYVNTHLWAVPCGTCPLGINTILLKEISLKDGFSVSTIQGLMRFSASRRLTTLLSRFSFSFSVRSSARPASLRPRALPQQLVLLLSSCALFWHFFLVRFLALRVRQAPWSQYPRVDVALRLHFVTACQISQFHLTLRSHPARRQPRPRFLCRAAAFCCCCRSDSADLACFSVRPLHFAATDA